MWSVKYKMVSVITETLTTECKVCKDQNKKAIVSEKRLLTFLRVIPIRLATERVEICPTCNARMKVKESSRLVDSKI